MKLRLLGCCPALSINLNLLDSCKIPSIKWYILLLCLNWVGLRRFFRCVGRSMVWFVGVHNALSTGLTRSRRVCSHKNICRIIIS